MSGELRAIQGQRIVGYVSYELRDKDGNIKKKSKHNMITPAAKNLILHESAGKMLCMNDTLWGMYFKQGVSFAGYYNGNRIIKNVNRQSALTNMLLNLTTDQVAGINSETNFVNVYDETFATASKIIGYANMSESPAANGKEGSLDYPKGADIVAKNVLSKKFKYPDGVATGTINAIAMAPFSILTSPVGESGTYDSLAPGFRLAKCLDRVNTRSTNFSNLSSKYCPPGVTGVTSGTEVISNYSTDGLTQHKIDLSTGEVTDTSDSDETMLVIENDTEDYIIDGDYLYVLKRAGSLTAPTSSMKIYQISTKTLVDTVRLSTRYAYYQKFLMIDGVLYINGISYGTSDNVLFKLKKVSGYWKAIETSADSYAGILTLPTGVNTYNVCFGNYGDKYIMYLSRTTGAGAKEYATGYIFSDLNDIVNTIEDCIPSLYMYDIAIKGTSVKGILSLGINRGATLTEDETDVSYNSGIFTTIASADKLTDVTSSGLFYSADKNWSNIVSIVTLTDSDVIEKGATDVLYVTYGYKIN